MIDRLMDVFGYGAIHKIGLLTGMASQVARTFEQEFAQDHDSKNAAIDALIELLQKHKNYPVPKPSDPQV